MGENERILKELDACIEIITKIRTSLNTNRADLDFETNFVYAMHRKNNGGLRSIKEHEPTVSYPNGYWYTKLKGARVIKALTKESLILKLYDHYRTEKLNIAKSLMPEERPCYLYYISNNERKTLKIGISKDPQKRIQALQGASSDPLKLLHSIEFDNREDAINAETFLHSVFSPLQCDMGGKEWFSNSILKVLKERFWRKDQFSLASRKE